MEHLLTFHELDEEIWLGQWMEKPREKKYFKVGFTDVLQKRNICILGSESISCQAMSNVNVMRNGSHSRTPHIGHGYVIKTECPKPAQTQASKNPSMKEGKWVNPAPSQKAICK